MQFKIVLSVERYAKWIQLNMKNDVSTSSEINIEYKCSTCSIFTDSTYDYIYNNVEIGSLNLLYDAIIYELDKIDKLSNFESDVKIGGKWFYFEKDFSKIKTAQVIDIKKYGNEILDKPSYMMAVLFTPKDHEMGRADMEEHFKEHFSISLFITVFDFFFQKSKDWREAISVIQGMRMRELKRIEISLTGTRFQKASIRFQNFLRGMWIQLQIWFTPLFYFGRNLPSNITRKLRGIVGKIRGVKKKM